MIYDGYLSFSGSRRIVLSETNIFIVYAVVINQNVDCSYNYKVRCLIDGCMLYFLESYNVLFYVYPKSNTAVKFGYNEINPSNTNFNI